MRKSILVLVLLAALVVPGLGLTASAQDQVTLRWFMRWDQARVDNVAMPVIEAFQEANPNITIEFENIGTGTEYYAKLQTTLGAGEAADVFYPATHKAYAYGSKGAMMPLNDYIERDGIDLAAYDPGILDLYTIDGQVMCLPIDTAAVVVFYNKEMFDAAGLAYPQEGWTWDDFLAAAQALTIDSDNDGDPDQFGVDQFQSYWPMMVWSYTGHGLFDDLRNPTKYIADDEDSIAAIQFVADLMNEYNVMPLDAQRADISDLFVAGRAAMQVVGHWRVTQYLTNAEFAFDVAPLPIGKFGQPVNRADGSCFAIAAESDHPDEAWEFVKFLAGPGSVGVDMLLDLQLMTPALVDYQSDPRFLTPEDWAGANKAAFLAGKDHLFSMYDPLHPMYEDWDTLWKAELGEVWLGNETAAEAVENLLPDIELMLEDLEFYE